MVASLSERNNYVCVLLLLGGGGRAQVAVAGLAQLLAALRAPHLLQGRALRLAVLGADVHVGRQRVDDDPDEPDHLVREVLRLGEVVLVEQD